MKRFISKIEQILMEIFPAVLLSFFLVTSSLCGFLSAFDISCDLILVMTCLFCSSLYLGLIAVQKSLLRVCGYCIYFCMYFFGVASYGRYINTGWYYIANQVIRDISSYLGVDTNQQYQVMLTRTEDAVTLLAIFIGMFLLLPLTSSLVRKKGTITSLLCTFPLLMIPIFIHKEPSLIWIILLCSSYLLVFMLRFTDKNEAVEPGPRFTKVRLLLFCYTGGFCALLILLFSLFFPDSVYQEKHEDTSAKTASFDTVSTFLQFGLSGFFNNYEASGGMSGGLLGGIYSIRPDYQTDLIVEFVPSQNETLYLRGFVGLVYDRWHWVGAQELKMQAASFVPNTTLSNEANLLQSEFEQSYPYASRELIRIRNTDALTNYTYVPYYSSEGSIGISDSYSNYIVYPYHSPIGHTSLTDMEEDFYLSVPDANEEILKEFCKEKGLGGSQEEVLTQIQELFAREYTYTMTPGKTPYKEDYVNYFLTKSKKGFCAHFASSAVLLLRTCGIPARYVEGYALQPQDMENGTILENKKYEDYHQGYNELGTTDVLRCEINDSQAHAWVEYFDSQFGWRVAEFTPPSNEASPKAANNLWSSISALFDRSEKTLLNFSNSDHADWSKAENKKVSDGLPSSFSTILVFPVILLLILWCIHYWRTYIHCSCIRDLFRIYGITCDRFRKVYPDFAFCRSHLEQLNFMRDCCFKQTKEPFDTTQMANVLETLSYDDIEKENVKNIMNRKTMRKIRRILWKIRLKLILKKIRISH